MHPLLLLPLLAFVLPILRLPPFVAAFVVLLLEGLILLTAGSVWSSGELICFVHFAYFALVCMLRMHYKDQKLTSPKKITAPFLVAVIVMFVGMFVAAAIVEIEVVEHLINNQLTTSETESAYLRLIPGELLHIVHLHHNPRE